MSQPGALACQLYQDLAESRNTPAKFQDRKIHNDNLSLMGYLVGCPAETAITEHASQRVVNKLARHS